MAIEWHVKRNIESVFRPLYESYLLLIKMTDECPNFHWDLLRFIFKLMITIFGIEKLTPITKSLYFEGREYAKPLALKREWDEIPIIDQIDEKIAHFKTIYKALYEGQSTFFKYCDPWVDKKDLTVSSIEKNSTKNSRTEKAWEIGE